MRFAPRRCATRPMEVTGTTDETGTTITFKPDGEIFDEVVFDFDTLLTRLREAGLSQRGAQDYAADNDRREEPQQERRAAL